MTRANLSLDHGGYSLFMDERITFDGVRAILHPGNFSNFLYGILNGGDQRYGRDLWNLSALASWIPEKIAGERGQILATRLFLEACLIIGAYILSSVAVSKKFARPVLFSLLLVLPYSAYYSSMPKPEPIGILMASFILLMLKRDPEKYYFVIQLVAGLSFGNKISFLVFVVLIEFFLVSKRLLRFENIERSISMFLLGLSVAVPILGLLLFPMIVLFSIPYKKKRIYRFPVVQFFLKIIIGVICAQLLNTLIWKQNFLRTWIGWTFLGTSHPSDSSAIGPMTWLKYFAVSWWPSIWLGRIFLIALLVVGFEIFWRNRLNLKNWRVSDIIFASGVLMNLSIFLSVHRLWGMYLWIGTILCLVGAIENIVLFFQSRRAKQWISEGIILLVVFAMAAPLVKGDIWSEKILLKRDSSTDFIVKQQDYLVVEELLDHRTSSKISTKIVVDPVMFVPVSNKFLTVDRFWGPLYRWEDADYYIIGSEHSPGKSTDTMEITSYRNHVSNIGESCSMKPCFKELATLPSGGLILVKVS